MPQAGSHDRFVMPPLCDFEQRLRGRSKDSEGAIRLAPGGREEVACLRR